MIEVPGRKEREKGREHILRHKAENSSGKGNRYPSPGNRESQRGSTPKSPPRHLVIKKAKIKERLLKKTRGRQQITYKGAARQISSNFQQKLCSPEEGSMVCSRRWGTPRILYLEGLSLRLEGKIKTFTA